MKESSQWQAAEGNNMVCSECHEHIPANQGYWLEPVGYGTRTICRVCKPPVYGDDN